MLKMITVQVREENDTWCYETSTLYLNSWAFWEDQEAEGKMVPIQHRW